MTISPKIRSKNATLMREVGELHLGLSTIRLLRKPHPQHTQQIPFDITLMPGDVLTFNVYNSGQGQHSDRWLFGCRPDLTNVAPGTLMCTAATGPLGSITASVTAELQPR